MDGSCSPGRAGNETEGRRGLGTLENARAGPKVAEPARFGSYGNGRRPPYPPHEQHFNFMALADMTNVTGCPCIFWTL